VRGALGDLVDGEHFFDCVSEEIVYEVRYDFPGWPRIIEGRSDLLEAQPALCPRCELNVCAHPADDIRLTHRACLTRNFATRFEEDQGGNAANAKFAGDVLRGVSIEL
jgi:hypothetical protein